MNHKYFVGERFNLGVLVCKTKKRSGKGNVIWKMKCDCGETFYRSTEAIEESIDRRLEEQAENERRERNLQR